MRSTRTTVSRCIGCVRFCGLASLLVMACAGPDETEDITVVRGELEPVHHVRIEVFTVESGFTGSMMTSALTFTNPIYAPLNIQFDFDPATDVMDPHLANCDPSTVEAFGATQTGTKVPVFYCPSRGGGMSGGNSHFLIWPGGDNLAHELGHYFHLNHIFHECWVPQDSDRPTNDPACSQWFSVETEIRNRLQAQCPLCITLGLSLPPSLLQQGFGIRDSLLDGDGIADTGISLHLHPTRIPGDPCAPGLVIPLVVRFSQGQTFDYAFTPVRNNPMGYYSCTPFQFSPTQGSIIRDALLTGNRNTLIAKPLVSWNSAFSDANGWNAPQYYSTIAFPNVNGSGGADVCGRGSGGINCAISNGTAFTNLSVWNSNFSDANGWNAVQYYSTIAFPDVDANGRADVCGRGSGGINCAKSNGVSAFTGTAVWNSSFSDASGWNAPQYYSTIAFPNINGTGGADVCGRGPLGIMCATSNGSAFIGTSTWNPDFSDANGWNNVQYFSTIRFPDVDGNGQADVCGRGIGGINCAKSNGSSAFTGTSVWSSNFSDANGWNNAQYFRTIAFPDLDGNGRADVCGRGATGIFCGLSDGTSFTNVHQWTSAFSDADGWNLPQYYQTIKFVDIDGDNRADVCGRGVGGVYCAYSDGTSFGTLQLYSPDPSDANGWDQSPAYYSTLKFARIDGDTPAELCGRGPTGIVCEQ